MSFHNKGLLGEGSSPGTPLTLDDEEGTRKKLRTLSSDPLSRDLGDPEFMTFKTKQFERAYPGKQQLDAAGRAIDSPPVVKDIEPFKPKVKRRDLDFGAPVGAGEKAKNDLSDLIGAKKALSNTKLFEFDVTRERSDEAGKRFTDSVKAPSQRKKPPREVAAFPYLEVARTTRGDGFGDSHRTECGG